MHRFTPRIRALIVLAPFAAAVLVPLAAAAESLSVLLQKAIYAEETEGNLDSAIKLYEQIAAEMAANRPLAAEAQYRLAVCYQKQGKKEQAVATLIQLQRQFPADRALGEKSRQLLSAMGHAPEEAVTLRKVTLVNTSWIRDISPDGRWVAYTGDDGEIYMREAATGATRLFINCTWDNFPFNLLFSPDSARVVQDTYGTSLQIANVDGSGVREIYKPQGKESIWPAAWLAKSGKILAILEEGAAKAKSLVSIDPQSGAMKRFGIPPLTGRHLCPSEDGRFLAIQDGNHLSIIDLESGREEIAVEDHVTKPLGWAHDDTTLLFCSDRTGGQSLWSLPMQAGKAAGEPVLIKEYARDAYPVTVKPDGRIYYAEDNKTANICVVSANFETGEITDQPRLVTDRFPGMQTAPVWAPDGSRLWFAVYGEQQRFVGVSPKSGKEEDFPCSTEFRNLVGKFSFAPDASYILLEGRRAKKSGGADNGLHKFDFATGKVETLFTSRRGNGYRQPRLAADGRSFVYLRVQSSGEGENRINRTAIMRRELATGVDKVIYEIAGQRSTIWPSAELSPDASRVAFAVSDPALRANGSAAIEVLDLSGGKPRELIRLISTENVVSLAWLPDGKRLVYAKAATSGDGVTWGKSEVWSIAIDSGRAVQLALTMPDIAEIAVHPDGRQLAFRSGIAGDNAQLWVMEGTAPVAARSDVRRPKPLAKSGGISLKTFLGPDNALRDAELGFSATLPEGWSVKTAQRRDNGATSVALNPLPKIRDASLVTIAYRLMAPWDDSVFSVFPLKGLGPKPETPAQIDSWLRNFARAMEAQRIEKNYDNYKNRAGGFTRLTANGQPALSWIGDYDDAGVSRSERFAVIFGKSALAWLWFQAPTSEIEQIRPAIDRLVESVRLP